jgi:hypothetical protein
MIAKTIVHAFLLILISSSVESAILVVTVELDSGLVPQDWYHTEAATRTWVPGCLWFDFVGWFVGNGDGFIPAFFQTIYKPDYDGNVTYTYESKTCFAGQACAVELEGENFITLQYDRPNYPGQFFAAGTLNVLPGGSSTQVNIQCNRAGDFILCDDAVLDWDEDGEFAIDITLITDF